MPTELVSCGALPSWSIPFRSVPSQKPPALRHRPLTYAKFGRGASLNDTDLANHTNTVYNRTRIVQEKGHAGVRAIGHSANAELHMDAAIAMLRQTLPQFGFRIVMPPPPLRFAIPSEACASIWRRGESQALSWHAATPALALLRAIRNELDDRLEAQLLRRCAQCNGIGWYIAVNGAKQMCQHARRPV